MANPSANTSTRLPKMVVFGLGMLFSNFLLYFKYISIVSNMLHLDIHRIFNSLIYNDNNDNFSTIDYTMWPFMLDTHMRLPFHKTE